MNERLTNTSSLESDLGLVNPDDILFPAPLDLEQTPPGEDELGQKIIDGSINDDIVTIPGLEDDYVAELRDGVDPSDEEGQTALVDDIDANLSLVDDVECIHERLSDLTDEIIERGSICRADVEEAVRIYPGLNEYLPNINSFPTSHTLTGYEEGLNALTDGQKAAGGGILLAVLAILFKVIAATYRVITSRANMSAIEYSKAIRRPSELNEKLAMARKEVGEILKRDRNPNESAERMIKYMKKRHPNYELHPRQIHILNGEAIADVIFADAVKNNYFNSFDLLLNKSLGGASPDDLKRAFNDIPNAVAKSIVLITDKLEAAVKNFNQDGDLKVEDYSTNAEMERLFAPLGGVENTVQKLKVMNVRVDGPKVAPVADYCKSTIDLTASIEMDKAVVDNIKKALQKKQELERLLSAIQDARDPDKISNRSKIVKALSNEYNYLNKIIVQVTLLREHTTKLLEEIQDTIKKYLAYSLNAIQNKKGD